MARSDVYIEAGNDHRQASIGGRRTSRTGWARLNTDNGSRSDCGVVVRVEVVGQRGNYSSLRATCDCGHKFADRDATECPACGRTRGGADTRKSCFEVELPDQNDENCEVRIVEHGHRMAQLARMGVTLCVMKGEIEQHQGKQKGDAELVKQGKLTIAQALRLLDDMEEEMGRNVPHVVLPTGVTLKHALACVEICRRMAEGRRSKN